MDTRKNNQINKAVGEIIRYVKDRGYTVSKNKLAPIVTFARIKFNEDICISNIQQRDEWILNKIKLGLLVVVGVKYCLMLPDTYPHLRSNNRHPPAEWKTFFADCQYHF